LIKVDIFLEQNHGPNLLRASQNSLDYPSPLLQLRHWQSLMRLCFGLFFLLSGCAVWGPDYQNPQIDIPKEWKTKDSLARISGEKIPEMAWWSKYHDPLLLKLVQEALARNNSIQSAVGAIYKTRAILQQIQMNWVPTVNAGAGYISTDHQIDNSTFSSLPFPAFTAGFIPNYSLNILQQLRNQEQAEANIAASVAAKNAVRLVVIGQVVGSYFGLREEEYRLTQQRELVLNLQAMVDRYKEAHQEGLISLFTLQQYQIQLAKARVEVPVIEYNIVRLGNAIHALLNENPGPIAPSIQPFLQTEYQGVMSANLPSTLLKNRPDVILAEAVLRQSSANIGVNTTFFFPTIRLTTPLGLASSSLNQLTNTQNSYWQYQGGINMPILNLGAFGAIKSAKAQYYSDYYAYIDTLRNAFASVDSALASHQKYTESLDHILVFFQTTHDRLDNEQARHDGGLVPYPSVLALKVNLNEAAIQAAQSKLAQLMSVVNLYQDMGGGYGYANNEKANDLGEGHRFDDLL
jgi:multidrug efflux system outer membrane protein